MATVPNAGLTWPEEAVSRPPWGRALSRRGATTRSAYPGLGQAWKMRHRPLDEPHVGARCAATTAHAGLAVVDVLARGASSVQRRWAAPASDPGLEDLERRLVEGDVAPRLLCLAVLAVGDVRRVSRITWLGSSPQCFTVGLCGLVRRASRTSLRVSFRLLFLVVPVNQGLETRRLAGALAPLGPLQQALQAGTHVRAQAGR